MINKRFLTLAMLAAASISAPAAFAMDVFDTIHYGIEMREDNSENVMEIISNKNFDANKVCANIENPDTVLFKILSTANTLQTYGLKTYNKKMDIIKLLLPKCSIKTINYSKRFIFSHTALSLACWSDDLEVVKLLLKYGAYPDKNSFDTEDKISMIAFDNKAKFFHKNWPAILNYLNLAKDYDNAKENGEAMEFINSLKSKNMDGYNLLLKRHDSFIRQQKPLQFSHKAKTKFSEVRIELE
jgi:hypothetical protein